MTVTAGVYREIYSLQGWDLENSNVAQSPILSQEMSNDLINADTVNKVTVETTDSLDETPDKAVDNSDDVDVNEDAEEDFEEDELSEKPLSDMSYTELCDYAKKLGVKANGMKSAKEIREAIKSKLNQ
jgi:hypothetical protein